MARATLEQAGETEIQIAYHVRKDGLLIGMVFYIKQRDVWQVGTGIDYKKQKDAIAALGQFSKSATVAKKAA